jgi:predicted Zn-dependent peptidase
MPFLPRYYVRKCSKPKQRAGIALVVKVGSVAEEDHEQGVAHILEHLAFNATDVGVKVLTWQRIIPTV